jgi:hypothetical protein
MRQFVVAAVIQAVQYFVLTINFRAIAHGQYAAAGLTAAFASLLAYAIVRRIAQDDSKWQVVSGMMLGGSLADVAGIYVTRMWS